LEKRETHPTTGPPQIPERILRAFRTQDQVLRDGPQTRDFTYVFDPVEVAIAMLERIPQRRVFNIVSGKETTILELAMTMQRITQTQSELKFYPPRGEDVARSVADVSRARNELGFTARTPMDDGLSQTIQWFERASPRRQR
jgi:UDP-glucose 4-epimerase